jgi:hypothetical protein
MATKRNKHNLSRYVPEEVKRTLRQRCGYGCVVCGSIIVDYEHLEPEFEDAIDHVPDCMTLVCPTEHRVKGGWTSKQVIVEANQNPFNFRRGHASYHHNFGSDNPVIHVGESQFRNVRVLVRILGENVLWIEEPEEGSTTYRLNACLRDVNGDIILNIVNNDWMASTKNWDVSATFNSLRIMSAERDVALVARFKAPAIHFDRIDMIHRGTRITCGSDSTFRVSRNSTVFQQTGASIYEKCEVGVDVLHSGMQIGVGGSVTNI